MTPKLIIRKPEPEELSVIHDIAEEAYTMYLDRMDRRPAPMDADFASHLERGELYVGQDDKHIGGYIVTYPKDGGQFIENVATSISARGRGLGRNLCRFAELEAKRRKLPRVFLYTNVAMAENLTFYTRLGYVETHRVSEDGFNRVYMEKAVEP